MIMVFENMAMRRTFRPKRDEVTGEWRRLHNEELYNLYSTKCYSGEKIKRKEMGRASSHCGWDQQCLQPFGGETWGKETTWKIQV
jgi:hypothetical protein